jgi:hypothetical protein
MAYNDIAISITGILLFFANYNYHPFTLNRPRGLEPIAEQAKIQMEKIKKLH